MSEAPSWLTEENISTASKVVQNPAVQKGAAKVAKNPAVQKAVKEEVTKQAQAQAPTWATSNNEGSYTPPGGGDVESGRQPSKDPGANSSEFVIEEETLKQMQRWHLALRLLYMSAAIIMAASAVLAFMQAGNNIGVAFFSIYVLFFTVLICCFEFALNAIARHIAVNYGFMYSLSGRTVFLLFVGFMSYQLYLFGKICMGILYGVGLFHAFVMWKYPRFEEYLRKKHYYEGKRANAK